MLDWEKSPTDLQRINLTKDIWNFLSPSPLLDGERVGVRGTSWINVRDKFSDLIV